MTTKKEKLLLEKKLKRSLSVKQKTELRKYFEYEKTVLEGKLKTIKEFLKLIK